MRGPEPLHEFEDYRAIVCAMELRLNSVRGDFCSEHLQKIHRHLLQDVYP